MINGKMTHYVSKDGERYVHIIPDGGIFDVYYQKDGYPMMYAFGLPNYQPSEDKFYDVEDVAKIAWTNFEDYEEEMFN